MRIPQEAHIFDGDEVYSSTLIKQIFPRYWQESTPVAPIGFRMMAKRRSFGERRAHISTLEYALQATEDIPAEPYTFPGHFQ
jgi:hypothetical protein